MSFVEIYTEHFQSYRHDVSEKARQYACGLMQAGSRKNMDRMAKWCRNPNRAIFNDFCLIRNGITEK